MGHPAPVIVQSLDHHPRFPCTGRDAGSAQKDYAVRQ